MRKFAVILLLLVLPLLAGAIEKKPWIAYAEKKGYFPIAVNGKIIPMLVSGTDYPGVLRAALNVQKDLGSVSGKQPDLIRDSKIPSNTPFLLVAGTLGKNTFIDQLVVQKKLDVSAIKDKWEGYIITTVDNPVRGVERAMIIVGSDKRGTIFGLYELAEQSGVSPWNWWADVPVKKHPSLFFTNETQTKIPSVKYRGIFINDEQPALGGWVAQNYGGFNSKFYEKVFELILRMKGNFIWPAMWGQSIYSEDPESPRLADEMGVVIGTSHHEPMMRAHVEWQQNGGGPWNYNTNPERLRDFWRAGIERMGSNESIVTLAMRGDGDEPMSEESNVNLLQKIVADQRKIIEDVTKKPANATPQVWALYKEVQDYYDKGMRVPDDVTILLCDDNWGNIRKLPQGAQKNHPGGYGIYYHYDYVGDPRNYKWINTNPLPRIWEQMNLARESGATKIWIVNVGDIKPMEFPIEFFLDFAFDASWKENELDFYTERWAEREFPGFGKEIGGFLSKYAKFNARRKPEMLGPDSYSPKLYSLVNYREAEQVVEEYNALASAAEALKSKLSPEYHDAYYQLVLYPVLACANINDMYFNVRLNHLYAAQNRITANAVGDKARKLFVRDSVLARYYNETMSGGKWNHFMDQLRIGYKGWHDTFGKNTLPEIRTTPALDKGAMGIALEGSTDRWPSDKPAVLPAIDPYIQKDVYVEIFNAGNKGFAYSIEAGPALRVSSMKGEVTDQVRINISANWDTIKDGDHKFSIVVKSGDGKSQTIVVPVNKFTAKEKGHHEVSGFISIEASRFARKMEKNVRWVTLPDHGRTLSAITAFPAEKGVDAASMADYVEYDVVFKSTGKFKVYAYFSPSIDFTAGNGLEFGLSFGNEKPRVLNLHAKNTHRDWQESVKDNIIVVESEFEINSAGNQKVRFWRIDPGVVLQRIVIDTGGLRESYLGPPETFIGSGL